MEWQIRYGEATKGPWAVEITPELAGWRHAGLRVLDLDGSLTFVTGIEEMLIVPLSGSCVVFCDAHRFRLEGRESVFHAVTDFVYLPITSSVTIGGSGRFAVPFARAGHRLPPRYGAASDVGVELRGAGRASRQVNNFCSPEAFECDRLMAVEVLTPGGNWSSYPPHKHDSASSVEAELEEIYYFEIREADRDEATFGGYAGGGVPRGVAYQRVYSSDRPIDVLAEVASGDVVLVPHGYHGPSMAAPGYDLYYLNVLAGPGEERSMAFCDDPRHAWIRDTWEGQEIDPRLPMTR